MAYAELKDALAVLGGENEPRSRISRLGIGCRQSGITRTSAIPATRTPSAKVNRNWTGVSGASL